MDPRPRLELELSRLDGRRPRWRLRTRAALLQLGGYAFLARWPLLLMLPVTIAFWLAIGDPTVPTALPPVLTILTILLGYGIGRTHLRRLPAGGPLRTDGWALVSPGSPLASLADNVSAGMGARALTRVAIIDGFTATLHRPVHRWRVRQRTLVVGSALTEVLDLEQLRAVIAHELAHGGRSRVVDAGIERAAARWEQLWHDVAATEPASRLLRPFLTWWAPKLVATAIALARAEELAADGRAAAATSAAAVQQALLRTSLAEWMLIDGEHLDGVSSLTDQFGRWLDSDAPRRVLPELLAVRARPRGDHPPLQARLRVLGADRPPTIARSGPAAVAVLDDRLVNDAQTRLTARLAERRRLAAAPVEELGAAELAWRAVAIAGDEPDVAIELLDRAVASVGGPAWWLAELGKLQLDRGDRAGLARLEEAMRLDPMLTASCCGAASSALDERDPPAAAAYALRAAQEESLLGEFYAERGAVAPGDRVVAPDLDDELVARIAAAIRACGGCGEARIAKKELRVRPDVAPVYLLVVAPGRSPWWELEPDDAHVRLEERLLDTIEIEDDLFVLGCRASDGVWERQGGAVAGGPRSGLPPP